MSRVNRSRLDALTLEDRFMRFVECEPMSGCWIWVGSRDRGGYGRFRWPHVRETKLAHRVSYFLRHNTWPKELDHLCRMPSCVNPVHLEPVTSRENTRRGLNVAAENMRKTTCPNGHPYDASYTLESGPVRRCRKCHTDYERNRRALHHASN